MLIRTAWLDYCLINPPGRTDKLYLEDIFGNYIVKMDKQNIKRLRASPEHCNRFKMADSLPGEEDSRGVSNHLRPGTLTVDEL